MVYMLKKAELLAKMKRSSQKRLPQVNQVETVTETKTVPKPVPKTMRNKTKRSAQQLGMIKALRKNVTF